MDNAPAAPKLMSLHLLEEITNGFSKHQKLGGGSYGDVYLGEHKDGEKIAVKVLKDTLDLEDEKFEKEYQNLASLHHKNVVLLVGSCIETQGKYVQYKGREVFAESIRRILCFEYMCNGSLDNFIYDESNAANWGTRYAIIKGICAGLEYLHEKLKPPMYHLDLKPANILLDENMSPKIADFGVSRMFLEERTKKTNSSVGTLGYIPPEYIDGGLISVKFDIFSLGVVIIKIMTGRDGYFRSAEMSSQQFAELVHTDWMNRLPSTLVHVYSVQVRRCIELALNCVEADRHRRPSIGVIVNILNKTESIQFLDASRNGFGSSTDQDDESSPVLAPKQRDQSKDEPVDNSPAKRTPSSGHARSTPPALKSRQRRESGGDDAKSSGRTASKKVKVESDNKTSGIKEDPPSSSKPTSKASANVSPVTEDEIRTFLLEVAPVTTIDLVSRFKPRLRSIEDKNAFADNLKKISKILKSNGQNYVVLREDKK